MESKIRLYFSEKLTPGMTSNLTESQSHYIKNVMRIKKGERISLFNSENGEWSAVILNHGKILSEFKVEKLFKKKNTEKNIWLAFSPIKKIPQDFMLQKTTELGIQRFIPIKFDRSITRDVNIDRAKKIVIEASEQSNRISIPKIFEVINLKNFLNNFPENGQLIFCDINCKKNNFNKINFDTGPICVIIGPEGDFTENERNLILQHKKTISISLASNILRAETAAIVATSILSYNSNKT
tara:strand:- start:635 stop:1354 length:720 start_codon:yes stop_codon:yes gene_type:complete